MKKLILFVLITTGLFLQSKAIRAQESPKIKGLQTSQALSDEGGESREDRKVRGKVKQLFRNQSFIEQRLESPNGLKKYKAEIEEKAAPLTSEQKFHIYRMHQKSGGLAFAINFFFPFGIGSFIQGDVAGGWTGLLGETLSIGAILASEYTLQRTYFATGDRNYGLANNIVMTTGSLLAICFWVYGVIRPWVLPIHTIMNWPIR